MRKAEELYMKHVCTTGGTENKQDTSGAMEVVINVVHTPQKSGLNNHRHWRNMNSSEISPNKGAFTDQFKIQPTKDTE